MAIKLFNIMEKNVKAKSEDTLRLQTLSTFCLPGKRQALANEGVSEKRVRTKDATRSEEILSLKSI